MNNVSPIGGNRAAAPNARVPRAAKSLIQENGSTPSETTNGERNARATDAAARKATTPSTTNQDGRGGNLDIVS